MKSINSTKFSGQAIQRILITTLSVVLFARTMVSCTSLNAPRYEHTECQFYADTNREIECGILKVTEDREQEDSPMIDLHFAEDLSTVEQDGLYIQALQSCRERLQQEGMNLSANNSGNCN